MGLLGGWGQMRSESLAARNPGTKGGKTGAYGRICVTLKMFKSNLNLKKSEMSHKMLDFALAPAQHGDLGLG